MRTQLANALMLAARAAPTAPQAMQDRGQKYPDSPDMLESDRTQIRSWSAQLQIIIEPKPAIYLDKQLKMHHAFNHMMGVALGQLLPRVWENGTTWLKDLLADIQLLKQHWGPQ